MTFEEISQYLSIPTIEKIIGHSHNNFHKFAHEHGFPPILICGVIYYDRSIVKLYLGTNNAE